MKIINPNGHPIIRQIRACSSIDKAIKTEACNEILKMITDEAYWKQNTFDDTTNVLNKETFMEVDNIAQLFQWENNRLGSQYWEDIFEKLYYENY